MIFAGGIPLKRDGQVVGAIGVSGGTGEQELHCIFGAGDAAETDDGDPDGVGDLVHHADGDGLDCRAGKAAGVVGYPGAAGLDIDRQG